MNKARVEAVSDGMFAIAITLLVLTVPQPQDFSRLAHELAVRWPSLGAYVVSFAVIGVMWFNHHSMFGHLARIDRAGFYLNLFLLLTISFLPYPTGVFGEALRRGQGARTAAVLYSVTMVFNAVGWAVLWLYASAGRRLLAPTFPEDRRRRATVAFTGGVVVYVVLVGVALVSPAACLAVHGMLIAYYAFDPLTRHARAFTVDSTQTPTTGSPI